jgi:bifunctional non-homologous end joining protein LigD
MLATTRPPTVGADWAFEPELDRWWALVYVDGSVTVRTRTGRDITDRVEHLQGLTGARRRFVVDGELVADAGTAGDFGSGRVGARRVAGISRSSRSISLSSTTTTSAAGRRATVGAHSKRSTLSGVAFCTIRALDGSPRDLFDACAQLDVEGVVAKRVDRPYRPGIRSGDWLKLRPPTGHAATPSPPSVVAREALPRRGRRSRDNDAYRQTWAGNFRRPVAVLTTVG